MAGDDNEDGLKGDEAIVNDARIKFQYTLQHFSYARNRYIDDTKFAEGDSDNYFQWPGTLRNQRTGALQPVLTVNRIKPHNLHVVNEIKQNLPGIKIKPTGGDATYDAAQCYMGLVRRIQYTSGAPSAYKTALENQVRGGVGYWRLVTDYINETSFDQEIYIRRIPDSLMVLLDPDATEADKSDARFGFVFTDMRKERFKALYPEAADEMPGATPIGADGWIEQDHIRVAEFIRVEEQDAWLLALPMPGGEIVPTKSTDIPKPILKQFLADKSIKRRRIKDRKIMVYKIGGTKILSEGLWVGRYIPIIPLLGEETIIEGRYDCKGHTRAMKDPQRVYNYWTSAAVEQVALQTKTPYLASAEAIEGYETYWNTANQVNYSVLTFNGLREDGTKIDPPKRELPPQMAPAYLQGLQISAGEINAVTGQNESYMGEQDNTRTGVAVAARQQRGDLSTYHFMDQLNTALTSTGKQILDLIPKVYDTERVVEIMAQDGTTARIQIDPYAKQAFALTQSKISGGAMAIFNPRVGEYWVEADAGPGYATKRQETLQAITLILTQNPQLVPIIGDILLRSADFPEADEAAERLRRMVPPQALGIGPTENEQQLQSQITQLQTFMQELITENAQQKLQLKSKDSKQDIAAYEAETGRFAALAKAGSENNALQITIMKLVNDVIAQMAETGGPGIVPPGAQGLTGDKISPEAEAPPIQGARKAPDGEWYLEHAPGKFAKVVGGG